MPSRRTFGDWAAREPEFGAAYEAAKLAGRERRIVADRRADAPRMWRRMLTREWRRGGGVSPYTPELAEAICLRIAAGESVLAIGSDPEMPCSVTIYNWARRNDDFREMHLRAKDIAADLLFDLTREFALEATEASVRADALRIRTLRWHTAMLAPKKYGARRLLGPEDEGPAGPRPFTVLIKRFDEPRRRAAVHRPGGQCDPAAAGRLRGSRPRLPLAGAAHRVGKSLQHKGMENR